MGSAGDKGGGRGAKRFGGHVMEGEPGEGGEKPFGGGGPLLLQRFYVYEYLVKFLESAPDGFKPLSVLRGLRTANHDCSVYFGEIHACILF